MFFLTDIHKQNYNRCIEKFQCFNPEYISTCYLAACPEIFKCFKIDKQVDGPFDWFFDHLYVMDNLDANYVQKSGDTAPLTSQTTALVHLGLNLWNGHSFDLAGGLSIWDDDLYKVALQAISLRGKRRLITYE